MNAITITVEQDAAAYAEARRYIANPYIADVMLLGIYEALDIEVTR